MHRLSCFVLFDDAPSKTESGYGDANRCLRRTQNETWHQISMKDLCNRLNKYERFLQQTEQFSNLSCVSGWHSGIPHAPVYSTWHLSHPDGHPEKGQAWTLQPLAMETNQCKEDPLCSSWGFFSLGSSFSSWGYSFCGVSLAPHLS